MRDAQLWVCLIPASMAAQCTHINPGFAARSDEKRAGALSTKQGTPGPGSPVATTRNADAVNKHELSVAKHAAALPCPSLHDNCMKSG